MTDRDLRTVVAKAMTECVMAEIPAAGPDACERITERVREWAHSIASPLRAVARDVRAAGDVPLVRLSEDGVTDQAFSLADELWLYALLLDGEMGD